jgi:TrpR-related protein YerC/YecD
MADYPDKHDQELIRAFSQLHHPDDIQRFLRDILTLAEIKETAKRFQIAKRLWHGGKSYQQIAQELDTSTTTVTRVADWLFNKDFKGYQTVFKKLYPKHTPPKKPRKGSLKVIP